MRCSICDYSDNLPSVFHSSVHDERGNGHRGFVEDDDGMVCTHCAEASSGIYEEEGDEDTVVDEEFEE